MTTPALGRSAAFAVLFLLSVLAGRMTVLDNTSMSMVWPAAGVAVVWFAAQRRAGTLWLDVAALSTITWTLNVATGASPAQAVLFVVANLVQVGVFLICLSRWAPHLWGAGGQERLARLQDLGRLFEAAAVSTVGGAAVGSVSVWLFSGQYSWETTAVWLTRNIVSVVLIGAVGLRLGHLIAERQKYGGDHWPAAARWAFRSWMLSRNAVELLAVIASSVMAYWLAFGPLAELRIAFFLIVLTVWVALRFDTTLVAVHGLAMGTVAVLLTLDGHGPFAQISPSSTRALVVQLFVGVVTVVGLAVSLGRDERDLLLRQVRQAQQEADERAQLFATVVDTMDTGLMVVDAEQRFLLCNPAATEMLGGADRAGARVRGAAEYGVFHPDGRPLSDAEQPYLRALAGEEVRKLDLVVRSEAVARTLSVNALPLATPQGTAAVVVFSDVTADRRHRDELTSFAGVVAHDLLNPLSTIEGWTHLLQDRLGGADVGTDVSTDVRTDVSADVSSQTLATRDGLRRISRASVRMRHLIHDLLTYTTARDGILRPVAVDLSEMLDEVVRVRAELPDADDGPGLQVRHGALHAVKADPMLLRRLLDNVVGNAVRYAQPGQPADVTVETVQQDGAVTVTVADRGIGVPAGRHEAIFDSFHRAHPGAGLSGTGLGLAICRRIVERHGGTIRAEDNPGGGTRITFTLPAATVRLPVQAGEPDSVASAQAQRR